MSNPEQERILSTIAALASSLRPHTLTDIQIDLLQVAERLLTNVALQRLPQDRQIQQEPPALVEFEIGEPCEVRLPEIVTHEHWQRTTIIDKADEMTYQTAATKRGKWIDHSLLRKVSKP